MPFVAIWSALVHALDEPMAIVDEHGATLVANQAMLDSDQTADSWNLQPIDDQATLFAATLSSVSAPTPAAVARPSAPAPPPASAPVDLESASARRLDIEPAHRELVDESSDLRDFVLSQFFSTDGLMFVVIDRNGELVEVNNALTSALGFSRERVLGSTFEEIATGFDELDPGELGDVLAADGKVELVAQMRTVGGRFRHMQWSIERDASTGFYFGIGRDITDERRMTQDLRHLAYTDPLTGLANRASLKQKLQAQLSAGNTPAILFCDLDRFKIVNDSLGHAAGDELLRLLGHRLEVLLKADDIVAARFGGDEFVIMLCSATLEEALEVAESIRKTVTSGFIIDGRRVKIGVSIGIALSKGDAAHDAKHLLGEADTAAYQAKESNRGGVVVHDDELQRRLDRRFEVEAGLASALAENRFIVHYQPIVQLPGQGIVGVEALVRWRDEQGNLRKPGEFVSIAQDAGLLDEIGDRVLLQATSDIAAFRQGGRDIRLAVNATAGQISDPGFPDRIAHALERAGMPPDRLTIEVTESAVVDDQSASVPIMKQLRSTGVKIAIDDFGTGYSSLSYLQQLPIDIVKIDRSFVQRIDQDNVALSVVRAVIELCHALDLDTVVEGIETKDQAAIIERLQCTNVQGYLFHEPLTFDQLSQRITGRLPNRVPSKLADRD